MVEFNANNVSQHQLNTMTALPPHLSESSGFFQGAKGFYLCEWLYGTSCLIVSVLLPNGSPWTINICVIV